tara:strand:+ start:60 stop:1445 length:1386 start_codon:yes stop_codon:yes gene_type:complete
MDELQKIFKKHSSKTLFTFPNNQTMTYKDVFNKSIILSKSILRKKKNIKNKIIFLKITRSVDYFIAILAFYILQTTIIPISTKISNSELHYLRKKYKPFLEIDDIKSYDTNINNKTIEIKNIFPKKSKLIFFTSGTTGKPKGIVHNFHNLIQSAKDFSDLAKYKKNNFVLHNWPHYYMAGFFNMFLCPIISGCKIFFDEEIGIETYLNYWQRLKSKKIDIAYLSPTMSNALISYSNYKKIDNKKLNTKIISTGAFLYETTKSKFKKTFGIDLINCYGVTEVGGSISLTNRKNSPNSIGKLSKGVKIKLSKKNEMLIKSKYLFEGYLESSSIFKKFTKDYFNSGDLAKLKNREFKITGRTKEIIKKGGEAVSLIKIEDVALGCNGVKDVIAKGVPSEFWGEDIELDVIFSKSKTDKFGISKVDFLKKYLVQNLSRLEIPRKIEIVKNIPKTAIGKNYRQSFI